MSTSANDTTLVNPDVEKESFSSTENAFVHALCTCSTGRQLTFQIKMPPAHRIHIHITHWELSAGRRVGWGGDHALAANTSIFPPRCAVKSRQIDSKGGPFMSCEGSTGGREHFPPHYPPQMTCAAPLIPPLAGRPRRRFVVSKHAAGAAEEMLRAAVC